MANLKPRIYTRFDGLSDVLIILDLIYRFPCSFLPNTHAMMHENMVKQGISPSCSNKKYYAWCYLSKSHMQSVTLVLFTTETLNLAGRLDTRPVEPHLKRAVFPYLNLVS